MKNFFLSITFLFSFGCKAPKQPELTKLEQEYFQQLSEQCKCEVKREIDSGILMNARDEGSYLIMFDNVECEILEAQDLGPQSKEISMEVYQNILKKDSQYIEIIVVYKCSTGVNQYRSKSFEFEVDSLGN